MRFADLSTEELRRFQLKVTEMLGYFDSFCQKNNLRYYLAFGSCLGAIRHKGFIPWDDDLDIAMPRPDYEKLWLIWNKTEKNSRYVLCRTTEEQCIRFHIMQLRDSSTTCIFEHSKDIDICHGLKIDICPLDGAPKNKFLYNMQTIYCKMFALFAAQRKPNHEKKFERIFAGPILKIIKSNKSRAFLWKFAEKRITKYPYDQAKTIRSLQRWPFPKEIYGTPFRVQFENITVTIPEKYDDYLKAIYHDYMAFPPEEKRHPETVVAYLDLDNSYKKYKGTEYLKDID